MASFLLDGDNGAIFGGILGDHNRNPPLLSCSAYEGHKDRDPKIPGSDPESCAEKLLLKMAVATGCKQKRAPNWAVLRSPKSSTLSGIAGNPH